MAPPVEMQQISPDAHVGFAKEHTAFATVEVERELDPLLEPDVAPELEFDVVDPDEVERDEAELELDVSELEVVEPASEPELSTVHPLSSAEFLHAKNVVPVHLYS